MENHAKKDLNAYAYNYLKEEVFEEGLTRNIPAFSRFFDAMAYFPWADNEFFKYRP